MRMNSRYVLTNARFVAFVMVGATSALLGLQACTDDEDMDVDDVGAVEEPQMQDRLPPDANHGPFESSTMMWRGESVRVNRLGHLVRTLESGTEEVLATNVLHNPVVSPDGQRLLYAVRNSAVSFDIHLREAAFDRIVVPDVANAMAMQFIPGQAEMVFAGSSPEGVVAVMTAPLDGSARVRYLTNEDLVPGEDWGDRFVPPPSSSDDYKFGAGWIEWTTPDGEAVRMNMEASR